MPESPVTPKSADRSHSYKHLHYPEGGHLIGVPNLPLSSAGSSFAFGGTDEGNASASRDSWPKVLGFLDKALGMQGR